MTIQTPPLQAPVFSAQSSLNDSGKLEPHAVHVWLLDINQFTTDHYACAEQIMNSAERERAQKFMRGKESYIASRWLLRKVLARYTDLSPEAVELLRTDKGKPYLPHSDIHFSLSHSGHWVVLAVSKVEFVGVDIEERCATRDLPGIAENYYHPQEFARMQLLPDEARIDYFYQLWTLKEAFLKAIGAGISAGLEKIQFELMENKIRAQIAAALGGGGDEWQFHQWVLTAQDYCALACKSTHPLEIKWLDALSAPAFP